MTQNLKMLPPKGSLRNNDRDILTTFSGMTMQESVISIRFGEDDNKVVAKARQIDLIPKSGKSA